MINPTPQQQAVALAYDDVNDFAPKIAAKGRGLIAEQIIAKAKINTVKKVITLIQFFLLNNSLFFILSSP